MKIILSLVRVCVILILFTVAVSGIFSAPEEDSETWLTDFIVSKGIGLAAAYASVMLFSKWERMDYFVNKLSNG